MFLVNLGISLGISRNAYPVNVNWKKLVFLENISVALNGSFVEFF